VTWIAYWSLGGDPPFYKPLQPRTINERDVRKIDKGYIQVFSVLNSVYKGLLIDQRMFESLSVDLFEVGLFT
jgi:hypothetical protein